MTSYRLELFLLGRSKYGLAKECETGWRWEETPSVACSVISHIVFFLRVIWSGYVNVFERINL